VDWTFIPLNEKLPEHSSRGVKPKPGVDRRMQRVENAFPMIVTPARGANVQCHITPIFYSLLRFLAKFPHGVPQNCILVVPTK
jgi:hypothetical protein